MHGPEFLLIQFKIKNGSIWKILLRVIFVIPENVSSIWYLLFELWMLTDVITMHEALDTKDMVEARRKMKICRRTYHFFDANNPSIPAPT